MFKKVLLVTLAVLAVALSGCTEEPEREWAYIDNLEMGFWLDRSTHEARFATMWNKDAEIEIPSTFLYEGAEYRVTELYDCALGGDTTVETVIIPKSVKAIGDGVFAGCKNLKQIKNGGNFDLIIADGFLYNGDKSKIISCLKPKSSDVIIPDNVKTIGKYAFTWQRNFIRTITIGLNVEEICSGFYSDSLKAIRVRKGNTNFSVKDGLLYGDNECSLIECLPDVEGHLTIPESVTKIGHAAFVGCKKITSITSPESLKEIGDNAFCACRRLQEITIPKTVNRIGEGAFQYCSDLKQIALPEGLKNIEDRTFAYSGIDNISLPDGVTRIGHSAFSGCSELHSIRIPQSVKVIAPYAFANDERRYWSHSSLSEIDFPEGVTYIGKGAFKNCDRLEKITFSKGVKSIGDEAFIGCENLESIAFADGIESIGDKAFSGCMIKSVNIPKGIKRIGKEAFSNCEKLEIVTVGKGIKCIDARTFYNCGNLTTAALPEGIDSIGTEAFSKCRELVVAPIPDGIEKICAKAFANSGVEKVNIPKTVRSIGQEAFYNCRTVLLSLPESVTEIGDKAFYECDRVECVYLDSKTPQTDLPLLPFRKSTKIHIPHGSKREYGKAWGDFWDFVEDE